MAALLAVRQREGLTYSELADRTGIAAATLPWWSWHLRRERCGQPELVPVQLVDNTPTSQRSGVSVELDGRLFFHLDRDFAVDTSYGCLCNKRGRTGKYCGTGTTTASASVPHENSSLGV